MSADNWAKCPRCLREAEAALAAQAAAVDDAYGKVTIEEFDLLREELAKAGDALNAENAYRTFREDYYFDGAAEGVVEVSYKGNCTKCRLKLEFKEEHPIPGVGNG